MSDSPFSLKGKTIIVAGASSGIGLSICKLIVQAGGKVIGLARREELLQEMVKELGESNASYIKADLSKDEDILNVVKNVSEVDGYVHVVGVVKTIPLKFIKREMLEELSSINYYSMVLTLSELVRKKKIKKNASIVLISSVANQIGTKSNLIYTGNKGALSAAGRVIASELAHLRIRVNTIEPGMVKTDLISQVKDFVTEETLQKDIDSYPFGYGEPEDVAAATVFFLSNGAKWITGQTLTLDGGWRTIV